MSAVVAVLAADSSVAQMDPLTVVLDDPEWVTARFAEMMTAAGFGRRTVTGIMPDPPSRGRRPVGASPLRCAAAETAVTTGVRSRVRSPPGRP
ncbi:hypothetical protein ACU045_05400 [Microbacterium sp. MAHUQ-60]|uniref:hypothetical protein n=1 Tax=unclassified Microbacterium TaxID=2609290 RepID=UPI003621D1B0